MRGDGIRGSGGLAMINEVPLHCCDALGRALGLWEFLEIGVAKCLMSGDLSGRAKFSGRLTVSGTSSSGARVAWHPRLFAEPKFDRARVFCRVVAVSGDIDGPRGNCRLCCGLMSSFVLKKWIGKTGRWPTGLRQSLA